MNDHDGPIRDRNTETQLCFYLVFLPRKNPKNTEKHSLAKHKNTKNRCFYRKHRTQNKVKTQLFRPLLRSRTSERRIPKDIYFFIV